VISPKIFFDGLLTREVLFFSGIPDSSLKNICSYISDNVDKNNHIIAANEGGALSVAMGYYLSTDKIPLVYMQNSGIGNVVNPLLSLADTEVYSIPMLLMIGWRGEHGVKDEPQHKKQGRITEAMLDVMGVPYKVICPSMEGGDIIDALDWTISQAKNDKKTCALLVKKGTFDSYSLKLTDNYKKPLYREDALKLVVGLLDEQDIIVSTTGVLSRELFEYRENNRLGHYRDFLTVGGMGHASHIALGIALQKKSRQVYCLDGDGALLMHMGALAINASMRCNNFKHIIFNNSAHDSVGGQPTVCGSINIVDIAYGAGYCWAQSAQTIEEIKQLVQEMSKADGPAILEIEVKKGFREDLGRPTSTPTENKKSFMSFIQNGSV